MSKPLLSGMLKDVLKFVERENGVRSVDVALRFRITKNHASNYLSILKERGLVYSQGNRGLAHRWHIVPAAEAAWLIPDVPHVHTRYQHNRA